MGFFNMSRTLSIDKIGPGPGFLVRPFLYLNPPCGDLGVSLDARLCSLSARAHLCAGQSVATAGALGRSDSLVVAGGPGARRKRDWFAPTARIWPQDGSRRVGTAFPKASVLDHAGPPPSTSTRARRAVATLALFCGRRARASRAASRRAFSRPWPRSRRGVRLPLARSFECGEQPR